MQYISPNPKYKFTTKEQGYIVEIESVESGARFFIAKDSMGTQICQNGKFYPDSRDFGSVVKAVEFLCSDDNLEKAEKFFLDSPEPDFAESLFQVMTGIVFQKPE